MGRTCILGVVALTGFVAAACSSAPTSPSVLGSSTESAAAASASYAAAVGGGLAQAKAPSTDSVKVSKCYTNATATSGGQMLIKASSSDSTAQLFAYRPDGSLIGQVQNGGGSRYGGTVMPWQPYDPANVTITSSAGGSVTVPTTPFQP